MKLLVDIGNSRIKWTTLDSGRFTESHSFDRKKTGIKTSFTNEWKDLTDIDSVYVSNVGGDKIAEQLTDWSEKKWQLLPKFITSEQKRFGVTNAYQQADKLGVDRWLALIAARQHARQATCIIDCGTAITIDVVTKYGAHQGGMILPGITLMRSALASNTSNLTDVVEESEFKTLAVNTHGAIQAGTLYMVTASLERIVDDLNEQFNNRIRFIITGGDAALVMPLLPSFIAHYPDIVLKGLGYYARQGDRKPRRIEAAEVAKAVEVTKATESEKAVEVTKATEAAKVAEVIKDTEVAKAVEVTKATEASKVAEVIKVIEVAKAVAVTKTTEPTKATKALKVTKVAKAAKVTKTAKLPKTTEAPIIADGIKTNEAPKTDEATKVVDVPEAIDATESAELQK
jgi:type III pantothenate kinase